MKIEVGKFYRSRDGQKARIYAVDGGYGERIHGAILRSDGNWMSLWWTADGKCPSHNFLDLIAEWTEPIDFDASCLPAWAEWIAMDSNGTWWWYLDDPRPRGTVCYVGDHCTPIPEKYVPKNYTGDWWDSLRKVSDLKTNQS